MLHHPVHFQPGPFAQPHHTWHTAAAVDDRSALDDAPSSARLAPSVFRRLPSDSRPSSSGGLSATTSTPPPALSVSTDYFPPSPFPTSSVAPSPSPSKPYHRSPYLSAREISSSRPSPRHASPALRPRAALPSEATTPQTPLNDRRDSWCSSTIDRVLSVGDTVGEGIDLQGEPLRALPLPSDTALEDEEEEEQRPREFEVVRRLGSGSYAVVYLVREVLSRGRGPVSDDGHVAGRLELDGEGESAGAAGVTYGREFAVKCLSKANLDEEALEAQMAEVTIHQSLPAHPNIVSLHRTFETSSFLLLLLEYVPGEDLFYFLEQARDHYDPVDFPSSDDPTAATSSSPTSQRTPPTPSLLSSLNPAQLLSRTRLRLIASMFAQMCDAVAACHDLQVFHRDIKPENFIVTDGYGPLNPETGVRERKVIVKLTDFGLSTTDVDSSDMDCGSAPYMSYECRNNIAPTYKPRAADVWSLGIVLINMLYHFNPWTDAATGVCSSFELYREQPVNFFMQRFAGMTLPVAEFLTTRVFNILDGDDDSARISAREFGVWVKDLPQLLAAPPASHLHHHKRVISTSSIQGHPLASHPNSRPASRAASTASAAARGGTPAMRARSLSRGGSTLPSVPASAAEYFDGPEQSTILEEEPGEGGSVEDAGLFRHEERVLEVEEEDELDDGASSRAQSTTKRRKRGARKGKKEQLLLQQQQQQQHPEQYHIGMANTQDVTLDTLASASQSLVRELSRQNKMPYVAPEFAASEVESIAVSIGTQASAAVSTAPAQSPASPPPMVKKASKWKLGFGRSSSSASPASSPVVPSPVPSVVSQSHSPVDNTAATASNVTSILMGLNAPPPPALPAQHSSPHQSQQQQQHNGRSQQGGRGAKSSSPVSMFAVDDGYGRRQKPGAPAPQSIIRQQQQHHHHQPQVQYSRGRQQAPSIISNSSTWSTPSERNVSPSSVRSVRGYPASTSSAASSVYSSNWRSNKVPSSAATSTSNFTRYSNGSRQSVSTVATSVSAGSWRSGASKPASVAPSVASSANRARSPLGPVNDVQRREPPRNVKVMQGIPWELHELPRQMHIKPEGDIFGKPPAPRKSTAAGGATARTRKGKGPLEPISEQHAARAPAMRSDASTSTTDLSAAVEDGASVAPSSYVEADSSNPSADVGPKKVQKGQINALAKMLSALRR